jgi:hypothetical protein
MSAEEPTQEWVEPNPADYGIMLGTNSCLDQCWEDFRQCLRNTNFPDQCIAQLSACQRACGGSVDAGTM